MKSIQEFITENKISITATPCEANPNMESNTPMNHWFVTFQAKIEKNSGHGVPYNAMRAMMGCHFSMGKGLVVKGGIFDGDPKRPTASEVLSALAMDAQSAETCASVADLIDEFGFEDYRMAERIFKCCEETHSKLLGFLKADKLAELVGIAGPGSGCLSGAMSGKQKPLTRG